MVDCIWKLRCHCIQIMHSDIYSASLIGTFILLPKYKWIYLQCCFYILNKSKPTCSAFKSSLCLSIYYSAMHTTVVIHSESPFASVAQQWYGQASADKAGGRQRPNSLFYTLWLTMGGFICTSSSWLSVISSSLQCCWARTASQMIESYQFRCHFAEPKKRKGQNRPLALSNTPYQNILKWLWTDSWTH